MKHEFAAVVLRTVEEQIEGGDTRPIDPAGVRFTDTVLINPEGDFTQTIGHAGVWLKDGRLLALGKIDLPESDGDFAVTVRGTVESQEKVDGAVVTTESTLLGLSLTRFGNTADSGQPALEVFAQPSKAGAAS